jgi:hypothetical protein
MTVKELQEELNRYQPRPDTKIVVRLVMKNIIFSMEEVLNDKKLFSYFGERIDKWLFKENKISNKR